MKKYCVLLFIVVAIVTVAGCGTSSGKYGDVRSLMEDSIAAQENLLKSMDAAKSASDVAKAINDYADVIESLQPKIKQLQAKYPELNSQNATMPKELLDLEEKQAALSQKLSTSIMEKMPKYAMDKEVMNASMRLAKISQM